MLGESGGVAPFVPGIPPGAARSLVRVLTALTQPREAPKRVTHMRNNN
jgi:hypothetical protein